MVEAIGNGARYVICMKDYGTKAVFVDIITHKADASDAVISRIKTFERNSYIIKVLRADGGGEFHKLRSYCKVNSI